MRSIELVGGLGSSKVRENPSLCAVPIASSRGCTQQTALGVRRVTRRNPRSGTKRIGPFPWMADTEHFKSSASAIPPRRLLRRSIDRQEMPQKGKSRAGQAGSRSALVRFAVDWTRAVELQSTTQHGPHHRYRGIPLLRPIYLASQRPATDPLEQFGPGDRRQVSGLNGAGEHIAQQAGWLGRSGLFSLVMEAEGVGFEPTDRRNLSTVFKTVPINHSGTPPEAQTKDR